jgi:hypothetical protein
LLTLINITKTQNINKEYIILSIPNGSPKHSIGYIPAWKKLALTAPPIANAYSVVDLKLS